MGSVSDSCCAARQGIRKPTKTKGLPFGSPFCFLIGIARQCDKDLEVLEGVTPLRSAIPIPRNHCAGGAGAPAARRVRARAQRVVAPVLQDVAPQPRGFLLLVTAHKQIQAPLITSSSKRFVGAPRSVPKRWSKSRFRCTFDQRGLGLVLSGALGQRCQLSPSLGCRLIQALAAPAGS